MLLLLLVKGGPVGFGRVGLALVGRRRERSSPVARLPRPRHSSRARTKVGRPVVAERSSQWSR